MSPETETLDELLFTEWCVERMVGDSPLVNARKDRGWKVLQSLREARAEVARLTADRTALMAALTDIFADMGPDGYLPHIGKVRSDRVRAVIALATARASRFTEDSTND